LAMEEFTLCNNPFEFDHPYEPEDNFSAKKFDLPVPSDLPPASFAAHVTENSGSSDLPPATSAAHVTENSGSSDLPPATSAPAPDSFSPSLVAPPGYSSGGLVAPGSPDGEGEEDNSETIVMVIFFKFNIFLRTPNFRELFLHFYFRFLSLFPPKRNFFFRTRNIYLRYHVLRKF
jgi:hypothetical protein